MFFNLFLGSSVSLTVLLLLAFSIPQWFHIPAGSFLDWVIGGASFGWLLIIVTVPWNLHFQAKTALDEADQSNTQGIPIDPAQRGYVQKWAGRSLWLALVLHLTSAIGLYALAATGISQVGYISSAAALLLTILRPALRAYEYLADRLTKLQQDWTHPREDVIELRSRVQLLESTVQSLQQDLDGDREYSFASIQYQHVSETRKSLAKLGAQLEEQQAVNETDHERLAREAKLSIAQLSEDSQFLGQVREIIRFFKTA
jgi:hypothetical protein